MKCIRWRHSCSIRSCNVPHWKCPKTKRGKRKTETRNNKTKQRQQIETATAAKNVSTAKTAINRFWPVPNPHHPTPPPNQLVPAACLFTFFIWLPQKKKKETKTKDSKGCSTCALKLQVQLASPIYGRKAPFYGSAPSCNCHCRCSWLCLGLWRSVTRARRMHFDLCALFTHNSCRQSCFLLLCLCRCHCLGLCPLLPLLLSEPCQFANSSVGRQLSGLCPRAAVDISIRRQQVERRLRN